MKMLIRILNKKRAVSPVIAVILLIGLAVAAVAAIFLVVLPLLEPTSDLELVDAYVIYDGDYTKTVDESKGYGKGSVFLANAGTGEIKIESISMWYAQNFASKDWTEITDAESLQDISPDEPYILDPLETNEELTMRFPIPQNNTDATIAYKIIVESADGKKIDTTKETVVSESDMQLVKDRPDITFTGTLGYIRRTETISPTTVSDNPGGGIKKVTYTISNQTWSKDQDITSSPWRWSWNTFNNIANGSYTMSMTVSDYAGLSKSVNAGSFIIDNDYIAPIIGELWITDPYPETQTAEVGESATLTVTITDSGTEEAGASQVDESEVFFYYRVVGSIEDFMSISMDRAGTTNNWTAIIESGDLLSNALDFGVESYVEAADIDGNSENTSTNLKVFSVEDNYEPDITHTAVLSANWDAMFINITATITDKDQVNVTTVKLYYRQTDDYGGKTTSWVSLSPSISGSGYSWMIWSTDITIHGLDYFFNATDRYSGHVAYEGTEIVPHHITIPDTWAPTIYHTAYSSVTHDVPLTVECAIFDNDPTFGDQGYETGTVTLYYRNKVGTGGTVSSSSMIRIAGNSSIDNNYETPTPTTWSGTIPKEFIQDDDNPSQLDYYILAVDYSTNSRQFGDPWNEATVVPQGDPNILYISDSITVSGTRGEEVYFEILNQQGSTTSAEVTKLNLTILSDTDVFSSDYPMLNMTNFNGSTIEWSDSDGVDNKTWITLSSPYTINEGHGAGITMTFENISNQPYSMYNLDFILELEVNNSVNTQFVKRLTDIKVPGYISQLLYMTSSYTLSTQWTTNPTQMSSPWRYGTSPTVQWGIRVFIGAYQITSALEAKVSGTQSYSEQQGTWICPQTPLNPTDSITISVRVTISGTEYTLADFTTGPLGAKELGAIGGVQWTINYWVYYRYITSGPDRTQAYFGFGDFYSWDSFVNNFTYLPA